MIKKIVVLGGGTSGLISALMLKKAYNDISVTVIENSKIGIIGVGEGTNEQWRTFIDYCELDPIEFIRECGGTIKGGIMFKDWGVPDFLHNVYSPFNTLTGEFHGVYAELISQGADAKTLAGSHLWDSKIEKDFLYQQEIPNNNVHVDTHKANNYLHKLCKKFKVTVHDDLIQDVIFEENGNVCYLQGEKQTYHSDFFIDASGFARVIMKKYNCNWLSYKDKLHVNSAIAFPTPKEQDIKLWTLAKGMNSGWMWRIPTWERIGNGYVFNDNFINADDAKKEVENYLGFSVDIARTIKFDAGRLDKFMCNNVAAVGLCASFIEPLESSAISQTINQTHMLIHLLPSFPHTRLEKIYNKTVDQMVINTLEFVQMHYISPREDTEFWKHVKNTRNQWLSEEYKEKLDWWKTHLPASYEFNENYLLYRSHNFLLNLLGLGLIDKDAVTKQWKMMSKDYQYYAKDIIAKEHNYKQGQELISVEDYMREKIYAKYV